MYHAFLIHSFTDGHLGWFQHLAVVNYAAMNIGVHRFFWIGVSWFLGYDPSSGTAKMTSNIYILSKRARHRAMYIVCSKFKPPLHILTHIGPYTYKHCCTCLVAHLRPWNQGLLSQERISDAKADICFNWIPFCTLKPNKNGCCKVHFGCVCHKS